MAEDTPGGPLGVLLGPWGSAGYAAGVQVGAQTVHYSCERRQRHLGLAGMSLGVRGWQDAGVAQLREGAPGVIMTAPLFRSHKQHGVDYGTAVLSFHGHTVMGERKNTGAWSEGWAGNGEEVAWRPLLGSGV